MVDHDTQTVIDQLDLVSFHDQLHKFSLTLPAETVNLCVIVIKRLHKHLLYVSSMDLIFR